MRGIVWLLLHFLLPPPFYLLLPCIVTLPLRCASSTSCGFSVLGGLPTALFKNSLSREGSDSRLFFPFFPNRLKRINPGVSLFCPIFAPAKMKLLTRSSTLCHTFKSYRGNGERKTATKKITRAACQPLRSNYASILYVMTLNCSHFHSLNVVNSGGTLSKQNI